MANEPAAEGRTGAAILCYLGGALSGSAALFVDWRAGVGLSLLGLGLLSAAMALGLGHAPEGALGRTLLRRLPVGLLCLVLTVGAVAALTALPLWWLLREAQLVAVLALSVSAALAWLALWRIWPFWLLAFVDRAPRAGWLGPLDCWRAARRLVERDPSFPRGMLAALLVLLLLSVSALGVGLSDGFGWELGAGVALGWWWLLAPALAFVLTALIEPARLAAPQNGGPADPTRERRPEPVDPVILPATPEVGSATRPGLMQGDPSARLVAAARLGRIDEAIAALDAGADPHQLPGADERDQRTLAMLASILPDTRLLRRLIAAGVDINRRHQGLTPLLAATRDSLRGRPDAVMTLLANGADPRDVDGEGRTPLHFAALVAEPDVAALLLDAGAPLEALNRDGYSPLGVACGCGNWRIARFLVERKARPEPPGGQPALLAAASGEDDPAGVQLLLRHKAKVDARGRLGRTALLSASLAGNAAIVGELLGAGANPDLADEHGIPPLLEAARAGANGVLEQLTGSGLRTDVADSHGRNALVVACQSPRADAETVALLRAMGVDPSQRAGDGRSALECAVAQARWPLVAVLDPGYPLPGALDELADGGGGEALIAAVDHDPRPFAERLASAFDDRDEARAELLLRSPEADAAIRWKAVRTFDDREHPARVARQLGAFGVPELESANRLAEALGEGRVALARGLLDRGVSASGLRLAEAISRLPPGASAEAESLFRHLLGAGADACAPSDGLSALIAAVNRGWHDLCADLLQRGAALQHADRRGWTALHHAAAAGDAESVALLLRAGARLDARSVDGCTAYGLALRHGRHDILDWLDWHDWKPPGRRLRDADLIDAAAQGDSAAVERLLLLGLEIDARDGKGATALLRACGGGHAACVGLLLQRGADSAVAADSGATCLSAAISMRHRSVVERLLDSGADPDQPLPGEVTPLMVAAALGLADMIELLLARGARPGLRDAQGNHALHALAQWGFTARDRARATACWRALLSADPAAADSDGADGLSPLLLLLGARADPGHPADEDCLRLQLDVLLGQPVDLDRRDGRGFGPLHLCALHGQLAALRRLLEAGADREARDSLNRRPQEIAVMRGFVDLAAELEPADRHRATPPSLARFLNKP
ncbi:ankyrin repeat domain-containing protein [Pseudomarimonas salicorniae]|uniref:Ankyrin repeat domain-containing protein n=1 Tax=Pseudomarimonas salicorniae TaxID=2933270 RepID=A0ABT0GLF5_9GAMM|nr:ankyrin repeat domain-containing protein [Lysobacter sp. CAU 1642]MCK7595372.1 ankyrin repeat domain-containing protein [Lysobacter sp. CAU 1642]